MAKDNGSGTNAEPERERWHLDKRVQISVIVAIALQTVIWVWAASALWSQVADHERRLARSEVREEARMVQDRIAEGRMARIEEGVRALLETAQRLERRIDGDRGRP